jgi:hypothetical protein
MLFGFFDESGFHDNQDDTLIQLSIGGSIGTSENWQRFSTDWARLLEYHSISYVHATRDKDRPVMDEAIDILCKHRLHHFGVTVCVPNDNAEPSKTKFRNMYEGGVCDILWHAGRHAAALCEQVRLVFALHQDFKLTKIQQHFGVFQSCEPVWNRLA